MGGGAYYFVGDIFLGEVELPSPIISLNLPWTNKKLQCKGYPYWFSGYKDSSLLTNKQTEILLLLYKDKMSLQNLL